tara:strand:+ start:804 stop:1328 length:525 start_codon:yes stop_codon:yes gene_type:complete
MSLDKHYHSRLTMALDDLLKCRSYARKMLKLSIGVPFTDERTIYEALFVALIVSYGRVFMSSNTTEKEFKDVVSNSFGTFRSKIINDLDRNSQKFHERLMKKRHTAIAHSDASSRNYQHYNDSPLGIGRNPYYPYEHDEVKQVLELVENLIGEVGNKQSEIAKVAFKNPLFQSV